MERQELLDRLGRNHGLADHQLTELLITADAIDRRYPGPDSGPCRDAALHAAHQAMVLSDSVSLIKGLRSDLERAEDDLRFAGQKVATTSVAMQQAARTLYACGDLTVAELAELTGQDSTIVQTWLR